MDENSNNGHKDTDIEEKQPGTLTGFSFGNAFSSHDDKKTGLEYLVEPGDDLFALAMRTSLWNKNNRGQQQAVAFASEYADAVRKKNHNRAMELRLILALKVSAEDGAGRKQLVDGIVGRMSHEEKGGFWGGLKSVFSGNKDNQNSQAPK